MRKDITVAAEPRSSRGKNQSRRLRASGRVPAVVYGAYKDSLAVAVSPRDLTGILHSDTGHNTIFNLDIRGVETTPVMIVDSQFDPIKDRLLHADLKRIDLSKRLRVTVPVVPKGEPKGVKQQGGLLEIVTREIEIECLPDDIPEHFEVDVTELLIGQNVRAQNVALAGSIKLVSHPDQVIVHVVALRQEAAAATEAAATPEAAAAEPEVIKKGKKEEEGAAAAEEDKKKKK
jgi:large subunit ribosomal protein L25